MAAPEISILLALINRTKRKEKRMSRLLKFALLGMLAFLGFKFRHIITGQRINRDTPATCGTRVTTAGTDTAISAKLDRDLSVQPTTTIGQTDTDCHDDDSDLCSTNPADTGSNHGLSNSASPVAADDFSTWLSLGRGSMDEEFAKHFNSDTESTLANLRVPELTLDAMADAAVQEPLVAAAG
ncbi:MAG TPA: hypothetical protein VFZ58_00275 [Candidatus Saccharimonadales bacterium]